jgi:hypothetical protein
LHNNEKYSTEELTKTDRFLSDPSVHFDILLHPQINTVSVRSCPF